MFGRSVKPPQPVARPPAGLGQPTQVSITDVAPCRKTLRIHVSREVVTPVRATVLAEVQREAVLPGFRKGKAPADLVARQYASRIQEESLQRVTRQVLEQAVTDHHLKPVGPFELGAVNVTETDGLSLEATVEVEPAFTLSAYKGIPLAEDSVEVSAQDVEEGLAKLQESMAQLVPGPEGGPKERKLPAIDDELAKDLGHESLEKLRAHVEAKLREQHRARAAQERDATLCEELLTRHRFEVPPGLVSHQTERLTRDFKVRLLLSGMPEEQVEVEAAKFTEQLRTSAQRHVKLSFILDRIAEQEGVTITQDELVGRLWQLAQRWKKDPTEVRKIFDERGLWPSVVSTLRQEKTMALVRSAAAVTPPVRAGSPRSHEQGGSV